MDKIRAALGFLAADLAREVRVSRARFADYEPHLPVLAITPAGRRIFGPDALRILQDLRRCRRPPGRPKGWSQRAHRLAREAAEVQNVG